MKRRHIPNVLVVPLVLLLAFSTSCATLFNPTTQNVPVTTRPVGGEVWVDGKQIGTAPLILKLDTRTNHDVTVRRGDDIRTWEMRPHSSTEAAHYLGVDAVVLVPGIYCAVEAFRGVAWYQQGHPPGFGFNQHADMAIGIGCLAIGLTPLVVDLATNHLNELHPSKIEVDFQ